MGRNRVPAPLPEKPTGQPPFAFMSHSIIPEGEAAENTAFVKVLLPMLRNRTQMRETVYKSIEEGGAEDD